MKRQERLALFFERESVALNEALAQLSGFAGLHFGSRTPSPYKHSFKHFFTAANRECEGIDCVFKEEAHPFPNNFFELELIDHPLDSGFDFAATLKEALRTLGEDGTLILTGFNRIRLCSWPLQNTFGRELACSIKHYSTLTILSALDEAGFVTELRYFDFCRFKSLNTLFAKIIPFLGIGFVIVAKRKTIRFKPLDAFKWNFASSTVLSPTALQGECFDKRKLHAQN